MVADTAAALHDPHNDDDIAAAVKPELMLDPKPDGNGIDDDSADELHEILRNLPLLPYMAIEVTPLAHHPSGIRQTD